jgi:nanoRNase/pAp phosphatase (c-di-AMP/oligoRNAs hydrolase)
MSEVGNLLALQDDCEFAVVWNYSHRRRECMVSLRGSTDDVDLSKIAAKYGGGGHIRAAGMRWCEDIEALFEAKE